MLNPNTEFAVMEIILFIIIIAVASILEIRKSMKAFKENRPGQNRGGELPDLFPPPLPPKREPDPMLSPKREPGPVLPPKREPGPVLSPKREPGPVLSPKREPGPVLRRTQTEPPPLRPATLPQLLDELLGLDVLEPEPVAELPMQPQPPKPAPVNDGKAPPPLPPPAAPVSSAQLFSQSMAPAFPTAAKKPSEHSDGRRRPFRIQVHGKNDLRRAVVLSEVLGQPRAYDV